MLRRQWIAHLAQPKDFPLRNTSESRADADNRGLLSVLVRGKSLKYIYRQQINENRFIASISISIMQYRLSGATF